MCPGCACAHHASDRTATAAVGVSGQNSDGNEAAHEEEIEDDGQEGEEDDAAEEEGQDDSEGSVDDCQSRNPLNSFRVRRNMEVVVSEVGEEVGEDGDA